MRCEVLANQHEAARILVKTMHDAGARQCLERRSMMQQAIHQRATGVAGARMNHQTSGFIDDQQSLILEGDIEFNRFRATGNALFRLRLYNYELATGYAIAWPRGLAVDGHIPLEQPAFETAT